MAIPKSAIKFYNNLGNQITGGVGALGIVVTPKVIFPFQETVTNETITSPYTGRLDLAAPAFSFDCVAEDPLNPEIDLLNLKLPGQGLIGGISGQTWNGGGTPIVNGNNIQVPSSAGTLFVYCYSNSPTLGMYKTDTNVSLDTEVSIDTGHLIYIQDEQSDIPVVAANDASDLGAVRKYTFMINASIPQNTSGNIISRGVIGITTGQDNVIVIELSQGN